MYYVENSGRMAIETDQTAHHIRSPLFDMVVQQYHINCLDVRRSIGICIRIMGRYTYRHRMRMYRSNGHTQFIAFDSFEYYATVIEEINNGICRKYMDITVSISFSLSVLVEHITFLSLSYICI